MKALMVIMMRYAALAQTGVTVAAMRSICERIRTWREDFALGPQ